MKIAYAFRRSIFYPYKGDLIGLPDRPARSLYLQKVRDIGFEGTELSINSLGGLDAVEEVVRELRKELDDHGTPCIAIRGGEGLNQPNVALHSRRRLEQAVEIAHWVGSVGRKSASPVMQTFSFSGI